MTWVKICGITNLEDALTAVEAGADAVGFVFYEKSPRRVDPETVREIVRQIPTGIEKVGVFVSQSAAHINETSRRVGLTAVQLYEEVSPRGQTIQNLDPADRSKTYVVLPASQLFDEHGGFGGFAWRAEVKDRISAIFVDSGTPQQPGGTGRTFDWDKAVPAAELIKEAGFNLVIAGGLTPTNVPEAIRILKPWGVDVSSGVESKPGKKDPEKIRAFVAAVRQAERLV
jgi:phosphoribosylanthranilate isomerase